MDVVDFLVTVIVIILVVAIQVGKIKKKLSFKPPIPPREEELAEEEDSLPEFEFYDEQMTLKNEEISTKSSKSAPYFTYEDIPDKGDSIRTAADAMQFPTNEIHTQEVENEIETKELNLQNPDELKKAIIYGEILKNPYN